MSVDMQHDGKTGENGPDRIVNLKIKPAAARAGDQRTQFGSVGDPHHIFGVDGACYNTVDGPLKPIVGR